MNHSLAGILTWTAVALATVGAAAQPASPNRVGVAAAVSGDVQLAAATVPTARAVGAIRSGQDVFLGDRVATGPTGQLQIMLLDQTVFTIGPDASVTIDEFVYDPSSGQGKLTAAVSGSFRFVTGRIANANPADMKVRTPVGTMGIRGTVVAGRADGAYALIVLLGPALDNNAGERPGKVVVEANDPSASSVELRRPGFATEINGRGAPPVAPFRLDATRLQQLLGEFDRRALRRATGTVASPGAQPEAPSDVEIAEVEPSAGALAGSAAQASGDARASGLRGVTAVPGLTSGRPNSQNPDQLNSTTPSLPGPPAAGGGGTGGGGTGGGGGGVPGVFDVSTFTQLGQVGRSSSVFPAQTFGLTVAGTSGETSGGSYTVAMTIDFGQRQTRGSLVVDVGAPFPLAGRQVFQVATQYSADGRPNFGPNDPAIHQVRTGSLASTGQLDFHYGTLGGAKADQLLSGVVFAQQRPGQQKVTAFGAGISTTSGNPIGADAAAALKALKLPAVK